MNEGYYTKDILDEHFKNMNGRFDSQDKKLDELVAQTRKTNGRVSALENWRYFLIGMGTLIVVLLIPILVALIQNYKI